MKVVKSVEVCDGALESLEGGGPAPPQPYPLPKPGSQVPWKIMIDLKWSDTNTEAPNQGGSV